jgi:hypothetical protein
MYDAGSKQLSHPSTLVEAVSIREFVTVALFSMSGLLATLDVMLRWPAIAALLIYSWM